MPDSATSTYVPNFPYMNFNLYTLHDSLVFFQNYPPILNFSSRRCKILFAARERNSLVVTTIEGNIYI